MYVSSRTNSIEYVVMENKMLNIDDSCFEHEIDNTTFYSLADGTEITQIITWEDMFNFTAEYWID